MGLVEIKVKKLPPTEESIALVSPLNLEAINEQILSNTPPTFMFTTLIHQDILSGGSQLVVVEAHGEEIVAYSIWSWLQMDEHCMLNQIYVKPKYRRKGLARRIVAFQLKTITAVLVDTPVPSFRALIEKHFRHRAVFGRYGVENMEWRPENPIELIHQASLFRYHSM